MEDVVRTESLPDHAPASSETTSESVWGAPAPAKQELDLRDWYPAVWWDWRRSGVETAEIHEAVEASTPEAEVSDQTIWTGPSPELGSDPIPELESTPPVDPEPWTVPEEWSLGPDQVWAQPEPASEALDAEPAPQADAEPQQAEERESEDDGEYEPSQYEVGQWDADPLELIFDESPPEPESAPSAAEADQGPSDFIELPERWVFSASRLGGSRRVRVNRRQAKKPEPVAAAVAVASVESVAPAVSPESVAERGRPRHRRGRHLVSRRSRRRLSGFEEGAVDEPNPAVSPGPIVIGSRRRSSMLASAVRILGVAVPLAAAALAYLTYVR